MNSSPSTPVGTGCPAASRTYSRVFGYGRPMPGRPSPGAHSALVAVTLISVGP
ncbi:hypothetical protein COSO111634_19345 [Corallococcus soli]